MNISSSYSIRASSEENSLPTGDWSMEGCTSAFDGGIVSCSCNHLTHFAILLSPGVDEVVISDLIKLYAY